MVGSWNVKGFEAGHALPPNEGILDGGGEGVADVQVACYVGWGEADYEFLGVGGGVVRVVEFAGVKQ